MADVSGSAWLNWQDRMMSKYERILSSLIKTLDRLPRWGFTITQSDISKLIQISMALGIDIQDYNMSNMYDFNILVGECKRRINEIMNSDLRPSDPILEKLENLNMDKEEIDNMLEVGKGEL